MNEAQNQNLPPAMRQSLPTLANFNGYTVHLVTPDGRHLGLPHGHAVRGIGFEKYHDNRTLSPVPPDFGGKILYETPVEVAMKLELSREEDSRIKRQKRAASLVIEEEAPAPVEGVDASLTPGVSAEPLTIDITGKTFVMPDADRIKSLPKYELAKLVEAIGKTADGSRKDLMRFLLPLAGKEVSVSHVEPSEVPAQP